MILAGGRSRRMGRDKACLEIDGQTLFSRTREMLCSVFDQVLIGGDRPDLATAQIPCVSDIYPGSALGGLHGALSAARTPWIFAVPCDLAHPDPELVRFILARKDGWDVVVPRSPAGLEPVFALYHKNCLGPMERMLARGDFRIYDFYHQVHVRYLDSETLPAGWARALRNLNTPEDLRRMSKEEP
ncbi:hypothetical protein DESUT3_07750 [Desulfuromonas versatilis]|uniref:MobA-like NTP transferase domain-containing protein n=1 Tax=Desulfuromonas versatilis TaxID=2802975 RepID=A0ABM9SEC3_9BACT|nr:hypothetical protein DESUT3_07750 [Desulfuromonas versatilis]